MTNLGIESKILAAMKYGARLTINQLRERTGASNGALWYHLDRLQKRGTIVKSSTGRNAEYYLAPSGTT